MLLFLIFTLFQNPDIKWQETRISVDNINNVLINHSCKEANYRLNDYEIWITKNIFPEKCRSKYNFENKKNVLY